MEQWMLSMGTKTAWKKVAVSLFSQITDNKMWENGLKLL